MLLKDIDLTDITVATGTFSHPPLCRGLANSGGGQKPLPVAAHGDFDRLLAVIEKSRPADGRGNYAVEYDGIRYRVQRSGIEDDSEVIFIAKAIWPIPSLDDFSIAAAARERLMALGQPDRRNGLVLAIGPQRSGKTTFLSSYLRALVEDTGETAVTMEDPAEAKLQGAWGTGVIYQYRYTDDNSPQVMAEALRSRAPFQMVGEVRTPMQAALTLRAALNGAFVIASVHAPTPANGLARIMNLASAIDGDYARTALAEGLTAALQVSLLELRGRRIVTVRALFTETGPSCAVRHILRQGKIEQLGAMFQSQQTSRSQ